MQDHDQRMKVLLKEFFPELIALIFPDWVERFDFDLVEWLEKEFFLDPPRGERQRVDLVAKLRVKMPPVESAPEQLVVLVHVEIEGDDKVAPFRKRMFQYYDLVRRQGIPVLPVAVYLRVGLDGFGWDTYGETFWGQEIVRFHYAYLGLPALDGEHYAKQENLLGAALSSLMRLPRERRLEIGRETMRRLLQCQENMHRRYLLCECLDAYLPLDEQERDAYEQALVTDPNPGVRTMTVTLFEKLRQEGREEGRKEGQLRALQTLLESRFNTLSPSALASLAELSSEELDEITRTAAKAQSLQELGLEP